MTMTTTDHPNDLVKKFHQAFGHPTDSAPTIDIPGDTVQLRLNLILEEFQELCDAVGAKIHIDPMSEAADGVTFTSNQRRALNLPEVADALGDLSYVIEGANLVFGIPSKEIFREIHESNMSKLGKDGEPLYREDGKVAKGPDYTRPDLVKFFRRVKCASYEIRSTSRVQYRTIDPPTMEQVIIIEYRKTGNPETEWSSFQASATDITPDYYNSNIWSVRMSSELQMFPSRIDAYKNFEDHSTSFEEIFLDTRPPNRLHHMTSQYIAPNDGLRLDNTLLSQVGSILRIRAETFNKTVKETFEETPINVKDFIRQIFLNSDLSNPFITLTEKELVPLVTTYLQYIKAPLPHARFHLSAGNKVIFSWKNDKYLLAFEVNTRTLMAKSTGIIKGGDRKKFEGMDITKMDWDKIECVVRDNFLKL